MANPRHLQEMVDAVNAHVLHEVYTITYAWCDFKHRDNVEVAADTVLTFRDLETANRTCKTLTDLEVKRMSFSQRRHEERGWRRRFARLMKRGEMEDCLWGPMEVQKRTGDGCDSWFIRGRIASESTAFHVRRLKVEGDVHSEEDIKRKYRDFRHKAFKTIRRKLAGREAILLRMENDRLKYVAVPRG